jgi:tetratricopeptide (TPR) repeat protein
MLPMLPARKKQKTKWVLKAFLGIGTCLLLAVIAYQIPWVHQRASWRLEAAVNYIRLIIHPVGTPPIPDEALPIPTITALSPFQTATIPPTFTPITPEPTPTLTPSPTPLPSSVTLSPPTFDKSRDTQDWNNCGPATLALYLRFYGWQGDQFTISNVVKPLRADKNVNIDELQYFVLTQAGWLGAEFRVGGTIALLKEFIAAGFPIMIEESFLIGEDYWPNDDHWTGHYLLLTGYDDVNGTFISQDAFKGPNTLKSYRDLDKDWKAFNRVYMIVFPTQQADTIKGVLGPDWDKEVNRQHALDAAQASTVSSPDDAFAWFNLGTNFAYFDKYSEAAQAYDQSFKIGLPQRMLRYQFGPFLVDFKLDRNDDLLSLTKYALNLTPNSEEILLWRGWALYRSGDREGALKVIKDALVAHPGYSDAQYALDYINNNP